jgi:hypothetical protein
MDIKRRERAIAEEIAEKIYRVQGPIAPEDLDRDIVCGIFADFFDSHQVVAEAEGARILALVSPLLAELNLKYAELNRQLDAAIRQPLIRTKK